MIKKIKKIRKIRKLREFHNNVIMIYVNKELYFFKKFKHIYIYMTCGVPSGFKKLLDVSSETNYR